uniref:Uncharacterized protein n=1 Tax=Avena sativa TaxID=4498 RepID=A0ACD5ZK22_AVESA
MDPKGSFMSEEDYICHLSPLHEMLRGTTAMLTLEQFQKFNNPKPISTPFGTPMLPYSSSLVAPAASKTPFVANTTAPSTIQENTLDIADYGVYDPTTDSTSPFVGNFMAPSKIQENPLPTKDASLNSHGVFNPSPVSKKPEWLVYAEQKPKTILRPSRYEEPRGMAPRFVWQNYEPNTSSAVPGRRNLSKFRCNRCEITFFNSQAYGGHMSSHSKANKNKSLLLG